MTARETPVASRRRHKGHLERGAAAVEMALVLPILLLVLMAMIDFGRAFNAQIQLSAAAREGVRLASLNTKVDSNDANYGNSAIATRVNQAAGGLVSFTAYSTSCPAPGSTSSACITYCPTTILPGSNATVVLTSKFTWITGISAMSKFWGGAGTFPTPTTIQATGVMRCTS